MTWPEAFATVGMYVAIAAVAVAIIIGDRRR